jgi:hypothetical protein
MIWEYWISHESLLGVSWVVHINEAYDFYRSLNLILKTMESLIPEFSLVSIFEDLEGWVCNLRVFYIVYLLGLGKGKPSGTWFPHRNGICHNVGVCFKPIVNRCLLHVKWLVIVPIRTLRRDFFGGKYLEIHAQVPS